MKILGFAVGPMQANAYLAIDEGEGLCAMVDPGAEAERLIAAASDEGAEIGMILITHAHIDHIGAVAAVQRETGAPVYLHRADGPLYRAGPQQAQSFGLQLESPPDVDREFRHGQIVEVGSERLEVRHTPGHSPGHVSLIGDGFAFVGDCVFAGSIGRTDLPGGDHHTLLTSINEQLLTLSDETILYSGHGPPTTVGQERKSNPFLIGIVG